MPPQVQEPIGAGSTIPLPAGDWVAVARYEEGRKGLDPSKSERSGMELYKGGEGKGPSQMEGAGSLQKGGVKGEYP